jgi:hypothetical protein
VLLGIALTSTLGIAFWESPLLLPLKLLAVIFHELGHASAVLLLGGHVESIAVSLAEGGRTTYRLPSDLFARVVVGSAGYLGSAVAGSLLLLVYARRRRARGATLALGLLLGSVTLLYARDLVSLAVLLGLTVLLLAAARLAPPRLLRPAGIAVATFVSLYALFDLRSDVLRLPWERRAPGTDAAALADLTGVPALVWAILWTLVACAGLYLTLRRVVGPPSKPHNP